MLEHMQRRQLPLFRNQDLSSLACFEGNVPGYHLELRDHPVMVWDFHSLLLTIRFFFSLSLTDMKNPLKMCEHCQRAFIAKRADFRFCSDDCRKKHKTEE